MAVVSTGAHGINDPGQIVGVFTGRHGTSHGFLYSDGSYTTLDDPVGHCGGTDGSCTASMMRARSSGTTAVATSGVHGFLYSAGTFTPVDDPMATPGGTFARGINDAGQIVGTYSDGSGGHGFLYDPNSGIYTTLDDPLATARNTIAYGINDFGQIVGTYDVFTPNSTSIVTHSFLYYAGVFTTIDAPGAQIRTFAHGINNNRPNRRDPERQYGRPRLPSHDHTEPAAARRHDS